MKEIWGWIQAALAAVGGFLGWFVRLDVPGWVGSDVDVVHGNHVSPDFQCQKWRLYPFLLTERKRSEAVLI